MLNHAEDSQTRRKNVQIGPDSSKTPPALSRQYARRISKV